jgi:hypothetical protein
MYLKRFVLALSFFFLNIRLRIPDFVEDSGLALCYDPVVRSADAL